MTFISFGWWATCSLSWVCVCVWDLVTIMHFMITSSLDYCNVLYVGLLLQTVWEVQLVQNTEARTLTRMSHRDSSLQPCSIFIGFQFASGPNSMCCYWPLKPCTAWSQHTLQTTSFSHTPNNCHWLSSLVLLLCVFMCFIMYFKCCFDIEMVWCFDVKYPGWKCSIEIFYIHKLIKYTQHKQYIQTRNNKTDWTRWPWEPSSSD